MIDKIITMIRHLLKILFISALHIKLQTQNIMNNLETSETWIVMKPRSSHLFAPLTSFPKPGMNTLKEINNAKNKNILL